MVMVGGVSIETRCWNNMREEETYMSNSNLGATYFMPRKEEILVMDSEAIRFDQMVGRKW
jgi:hypothetical protein